MELPAPEDPDLPQSERLLESAAVPDYKHELSARKLQRLQAAQQNKGVVYINRIPPHMKPQKLRHLLSQYGKLGRIYLAPEDSSIRSRRRKHGGDTGKHFSEGWVEFTEKKQAKEVVQLLNNNPIGGKRRSAYHYDLWCLKYLHKFKWDHLTEELAYQNAVREQKLAQEISAANRERDFYLSRVNKAKGIAAQEDRKRKKAAPKAEENAVEADEQASTKIEPIAAPEKAVRGYGQRRPKPDPVTGTDASILPYDVMASLAGKRAKSTS